MKAFWTYTLARFAVLAVVFAVVWLAAPLFFERTEIVNIFVLLVSLVISSIISIFLLSGLRARLAEDVHARAERMSSRLEESRRAEDVD
ncbi:DUF4229 domain-containing protein [Aeromicrobium chenweiae]|uniref:DUF4229 domain-containing protein n=1 Tax=Aeromicrobium chenweiae TaxID=2079793 RepID=A0A2S0WQC6_9ACTN|nr:DUF4229 domain-containing protein [Aeromicrobium chenweiae]AWB93536.1 DUF4229 domain-containing protein [Aeromicrobium chenweiae]TGN33186.1 DUF4229 domain-containing protein [Aeromicrobium chenweiae]